MQTNARYHLLFAFFPLFLTPRAPAAPTIPLVRGSANGAPVLRVMPASAKGAVARRQGGKKHASSLGGALDTVPVLRVMPASAKGAVAHRQGGKKHASSLGGALDTAPVLRVMLASDVTRTIGPGESARYRIQSTPCAVAIDIDAASYELTVAFSSRQGAPEGYVTVPRRSSPITIYATGFSVRAVGNHEPVRISFKVRSAAAAAGDLETALKAQELRTRAFALMARRQANAREEAAAADEAAASSWKAVHEIQAASQSWISAGDAFLDSGKADDAIRSYKSAAEVCQQNKMDGCQAFSLLELGTAYDGLGKPDESRAALQQARALFEETKNPFGEGKVHKQIGEMEDTIGHKEIALDEYNRALALFRSIGDRNGEGQILSDMGVTYQAVSKFQIAMKCYRQASELLLATGDLADAAVNYTNLGVLCEDMGDMRQALAYQQKALPLLRTVGQVRNEGYCLHGIGSAYRKMGNDVLAERYIRQALITFRQSGDMRGKTTALNNLGRIYATSGRTEKALTSYREALHDFEESRNPTGEGYALSNIGDSLTDLGRFAEAKETLDKAVMRFQKIPDPAGEGFARQRLARLARAQGDYAGARAQIDTALAKVESIRQEVSEVDRRAEYFATVRDLHEFEVDVIASQAKNHPEGEFAQEAFASSDRLRARSLQEWLASPAGETEDASQRAEPPLAKVTALQKLAGRGSALLEYMLGEERSYAWVITANRFSMKVLPKRRTLEQMAQQMTKELTGNEIQRGASAALSRWLLSPFAMEIAGKTLVIAADGGLQSVPFNLLPSPGAPGRYLIEEHEIEMTPSFGTARLLHERAAKHPPPSGRILIFADPVYETADSRLKPIHSKTPEAGLQPEIQLRGGSPGIFTRMLHSEQEALAIERLAKPGTVDVYYNFRATRAEVLKVPLDRFRILHFAVHGVMNGQQTELSGLVFSLVDEQGQPLNGFLRAADIENLKTNADLVVLSSCETALGRDVKGEGAMSLSRAFLKSGARRTIAAQWKVPEGATSELMRRFYRGMLADGLSATAALRRAQLEMLRESAYRQPLDWAAFTLYGDWR